MHVHINVHVHAHVHCTIYVHRITAAAKSSGFIIGWLIREYCIYNGLTCWWPSLYVHIIDFKVHAMYIPLLYVWTIADKWHCYICHVYILYNYMANSTPKKTVFALTQTYCTSTRATLSLEQTPILAKRIVKAPVQNINHIRNDRVTVTTWKRVVDEWSTSNV